MFEYMESECIDNDFELSMFNVIFGFQSKEIFTNIFNFILLMAKWIIWVERNRVKYQNINVTPLSMFEKLRNIVLGHLILLRKQLPKQFHDICTKYKEKIETFHV